MGAKSEAPYAVAMSRSQANEKYISVVTFRKSGAAVATPTWVVPLDGGRLGFWTSSSTGKAKRLRNNPAVTVTPCDSRGKTDPSVPPTRGTAVLMTAGADYDEIQSKVRAKYGVMVPVSRLLNTLGHLGKGKWPYGDLGVVVSIDNRA